MSVPSLLLVAVCDDEPMAAAQIRRFLERCLEDTPHKIEVFTQPEALLAAAARQRYGLAVLDVQMPRQNGIELGQHLLERCPGCQIIFLTAYIAFCQDVYDVSHIAFVLKEEMEARLPAALARAGARLEPNVPTLVAGPPGAARLVPQADILYLERRVRTTWVHTADTSLPVREKLEDLLARLDPVYFCQTHKSFAVHWPYAERYERTCIQLSNGFSLPISRAHAAAVRASFLRYTETLLPSHDHEEVTP